MSKTSKWLSISLAAVFMVAASAASAQPRGPRGGEGRFGGPPGMGRALLEGPLAERLELTDEQREMIRGIVEAERQAIRPWHEDLLSIDKAVDEAVQAEPFDEEAVRAAARQAADIRVELAVARARVANEVRQVLTPDQRELLGELRAERREHHGVFGGSHHRGTRGGFRHHGPGQ
jgi:protein CpxP